MTEQKPPEILASDTEREQTCRLLQEASIDGRLTLEELSLRVEQALAARTQSELQEVLRDLPATAPPASRQEPVSSSVVVLSSSERRGPWRIGERCRALVVMGECKLDLRRAIISAPLTTIEVRVIMGSLEVIVPEGLEVDLEAGVALGSKNLRLDSPRRLEGPVVRITGLVLAGSVTVRDHPTFGERLSARLGGSITGNNDDRASDRTD